jgi:stearoyl-CoA desaturase (delta-9 desaturase)
MDSHSPRDSKWYAAGFWMLRGQKFIIDKKQIKNLPVDLIRDPLLRFFDRYYYYLWASIIISSFLLSPIFCIFFILSPVAYGYINAGFITLGCHIKLPGSYKNYERDDDSFNNKWIQLYLLGDGLHNNHHENPSNYTDAHKTGEFDLVGLIAKKIFIV